MSSSCETPSSSELAMTTAGLSKGLRKPAVQHRLHKALRMVLPLPAILITTNPETTDTAASAESAVERSHQ